jgi:hypothetical protein
MENLEQYTAALRKMLSKALARRKNLLTYARHVAPTLPDREQAAKTLARHAIELDILNAHIEGMQAEMKALKRQLSDKGVSFTLKEVKPVQPRKRPEKSPYVANGKKWFDDADKAIEFIKNLMQRGYSFRVLGSKKVPPIIGGSFGGFGIQWCDTTEGGKLFFYTDRPSVFRAYSISK